MSPDKKKAGRAASDSTLKIREYLARLPGEKFESASIDSFRHATSNPSAKANIFNIEKAKERKRRGFQSPRARKPKAQAAAVIFAPAPASRQVQILASLPLTAYPNMQPAEVKAFAADLVKCFHPGGQVVLLSDPPAIEIRVPA